MQTMQMSTNMSGTELFWAKPRTSYRKETPSIFYVFIFSSFRALRFLVRA